jgi:hypothetical protein
VILENFLEEILSEHKWQTAVSQKSWEGEVMEDRISSLLMA